MKRIILIIISFVVISGISFSQAPVKRKKQTNTEQTQSSRGNKKHTTNTKRNAKSEVKISDPDGYINGYGYVNLGLPSGTKWATCNIGASSPQDCGEYYAWGETKTKSNYQESNSFTSGKSMKELITENIIDVSGNLNKQYDAAYMNWGGSWRMPTLGELEELKDKCKWNWVKSNGRNGYLVVGPNGKSLFFPAAGDKIGNTVNTWGDDHLVYWGASTDEDGIHSGKESVGIGRFTFGGISVEVHDFFRYVGQPIRPVY